MKNHIDLSRFPFFSGLPEQALKKVETFSTLESYEKGDIVFQNNDPAENLYGLVSGTIDLSILFKEEIVTRKIKYEEYITTQVEVLEKPVIFEQVKDRDIFGWSALVAPEKMTATARCTSDCDVVHIPSPELKQAFSTDPELGYILSSRLNALIARRLNNRTQSLVEAWCALFEAGEIERV